MVEIPDALTAIDQLIGNLRRADNVEGKINYGCISGERIAAEGDALDACLAPAAADGRQVVGEEGKIAVLRIGADGGCAVALQQAAAQIEVEKPFPQEEELAEKSARLAELNAQLDVDEKSHEPEQDEEEQENVSRRPSVLAALEEKSDKPEPVKPFRSYYDKDGDAR